jgi:hypothetical protein
MISKKHISVLNYTPKHYAMKVYCGVGYNCTILTLNTRWRWVVNFLPLSLYLLDLLDLLDGTPLPNG